MRTYRKILIAAGGTGGHLFPALALAREMRAQNVDVLFAGSGLRTSPFFPQQEFVACDVASSTPFQQNFLHKALFVWPLIRGLSRALLLMRRERPHLVVGFGSFHSFPVLLAAWLTRVPILLFEGNCIPGKVNRWFSRAAIACAVQFKEANQYFAADAVEVAMPRTKTEKVEREIAHRYFTLDAHQFTLLVFGGSQGAQSINTQMSKIKFNIPLQVIHLAGRNANIDEIEASYRVNGINAIVKRFEDKMEFAWSAADLAVCRAGAATLAEMLAFCVPAILLPFPYATDDHQRINATYFIKQVKGAILCNESALKQTLFALLADQEKIAEMRYSLRVHQARKRPSLSNLVLSILPAGGVS